MVLALSDTGVAPVSGGGARAISESCIPLQFALPVPLAGARCHPRAGSAPAWLYPGAEEKERSSVTLACLLPKLVHPPIVWGVLGLSWGGLA